MCGVWFGKYCQLLPASCLARESTPAQVFWTNLSLPKSFRLRIGPEIKTRLIDLHWAMLVVVPSAPCSVIRKSVFPVMVSSSGIEGSMFTTIVSDPTVLFKDQRTNILIISIYCKLKPNLKLIGEVGYWWMDCNDSHAFLYHYLCKQKTVQTRRMSVCLCSELKAVYRKITGF